MPDETENGFPVSHSARIPPTGADISTPTSAIAGNLKFR